MAKKKVNIELNMTPFIGLFALLVVTLLLTAVWNQVLVLSTDTSNTTASNSESPPPPSNKKNVTLNVTILPHHLEMAENEKGINLPHINGEIDLMRMVQVLQAWKTKYPDKTDIVLNTENSVTYNKLIKVFDTLVGNDWPDIGINTQ